jgi:hypothetical protein
MIQTAPQPPRNWDDTMEQEHVLRDIPEDEIKKIVADYQSEGAAVTVARQKDGLWTVRASFATPKAGSA